MSGYTSILLRHGELLTLNDSNDQLTKGFCQRRTFKTRITALFVDLVRTSPSMADHGQYIATASRSMTRDGVYRYTRFSTMLIGGFSA